jgi:hypothetical protein
MHFSRTVLVALAAYASGAAARPWAQNVPNAQALRFGKRFDNTSSSSDMPIAPSSSADQPQTTVSLDLTTTSVPVSTDSSSSNTATLSSSDSSSPSSTSASATATATAQAISVPGGTYSAVGCYTDTANVGFPLIGAMRAADTTSASQCLNECASPSTGGPYVYAGVEGTECFCSNSYDSAAPQSPGACSGNLKKRAGGTITLFQVSKTLQKTIKY